MSIKVMSMVWERYPASGGELLLALALADHCHDDGKSIYIGVQSLAHKTRQGVRTVQLQLRRMQVSGWLMKVGAGHGGRGRHTVYRINPQWLKGADIAPFSESTDRGAGPDAGGDVGGHGDPGFDRTESDLCGPEDAESACPEGGGSDGGNALKGATATAPFSQTERVQSEAQKGAIAVAPTYKPAEPYYSPIPPHEGDSVSACATRGAQGHGGGRARPRVSKSKDREKSGGVTLAEYIADCQARGVMPVPEDAAVFGYADTVGLPVEMLLLHWHVFRERNLRTERRCKGWLDRLLSSVEGNWFGLWALQPGGGCLLTTKGLQAQAWHSREAEQ